MPNNSNVRHVPPHSVWYWRMHGGNFAPINQCGECDTIAFSDDLHLLYPCKYCGGKVSSIGSGKWIPAVTRWRWFKRIIVTKGYWMPPSKRDVVGLK